jgi:signal transduction histidine kinase
VADALAADPTLLQVIRDSDASKIGSVLLSARIRMKLHHLEIVDKNGENLGREHRFEGPLNTVAISQLHDLGLAELEHAHMIQTSVGFLLVAVRPLEDARGTVGAMSVGRLVDGQALVEMNFGRVDPVILGFDHEGNVTATSEDAVKRPGEPKVVMPDTKMLMMARSGQVSHGSAKLGDSELRAVYAPLPTGGHNQGVFGVTISTSPAVGLRDKLIADYVVVMGPLALVVLLLGYLVAHAISRRILRLRDSAVEIGKRNLSVRIETNTGDEVDALASEFNRMADSLSEKNGQLEEANRLLELRVAIRTNELKEANDQVLEMQEQVVNNEKLAAIGELSAGVAHDLRNPLGAIRNGVYFLNKKLRASEFAKNEPRVGEFLAVIDERVTHCDKIITDLITFARISKPCYSETRVLVAIDSALIGVTLPDNVSLVKRCDEEEPKVRADREQLQRVFSNLAQNAYEAMPEGGVLTIGIESVDSTMRVSFEDEGEGIKEEEIGRVLDPLFTTKIQGTGLGLAVCHQIISNHSGSLEVSSVLGQGSTFTVVLPINGAPAPATVVFEDGVTVG